VPERAPAREPDRRPGPAPPRSRAQRARDGAGSDGRSRLSGGQGRRQVSMSSGPAEPPLTREQLDWVLEARPGAMRAALRLGAGTPVALTRADLRAWAGDGLLRAARTFEPGPDHPSEKFSYKHVRGAVLRPLHQRPRQLQITTPPAIGDAERAP